VRAWIGLGGNLDGSRGALSAAVKAMDAVGTVQSISSLYRSAPRDREDQPDFLNAVVGLETEREPRRLLGELKSIEIQLGRHAEGARFGPRLVDLDLLAVDFECINDPPILVVPHPRLAERRFALEPLAELDPGLRPWSACRGERRDLTVAVALAAVRDQDVEAVEDESWAGDIGLS
jgi:2-amino-4-hydroxy-6-hydroxymethyldihydropteridine diphosphokinase